MCSSDLGELPGTEDYPMFTKALPLTLAFFLAFTTFRRMTGMSFRTRWWGIGMRMCFSSRQ